ncbi:tetratricopeptide repeat protein [Cyanobacterium stanieri LEGE 03274]|uniref:Tetratricopeptide repeat protein n=1 Tax=Cyanobacterium stanieri LEGE 03274 TaxID=1828756 RepID=A0ABR9V2W0_9CHRO|nr:tetratricopeptide repeat protein [Cyanobacterium stanieri]MBE9222236.1 tetratricopeptide repeat protein [Cyanobacterium stanieri LEGE 03274]
MDKQVDVLGYVGLGVTALGAIASAVTGQVLPLSVASTIGVGCNVFSRKQSEERLVDGFNGQGEKIESLQGIVEANHGELKEAMVMGKADFGNQVEDLKLSLNERLNNIKDSLDQNVSSLNAETKEIKDIVTNLRQVEVLSQELRVKPDSATFFYERGNSHHKLGNVSGAIADYTEAIKKDGNHAQAYHKRGILYLDSGERQKAVDDLRKASLLYFEKGEIESYHQAREMSKNVHELENHGNGSNGKVLIGAKLFS